MPRAGKPTARSCRYCPGLHSFPHLGWDATGASEYVLIGAHVYALEPSDRLRRVCRVTSPNRLGSRAARMVGWGGKS
jgi:hypothetical protein